MTASVSFAADTVAAVSPPPVAVAAPQPTSTRLTRVSLALVEPRFKLCLRFGVPERTLRLDRWRSIAMFLPGVVFCRTRWQVNAAGSVRSQLLVAQTSRHMEVAQRIPGVKPGACVLLRISGTTAVQAVLERIDAIEALGIAPAAVAPAYWRTLGRRLAAGLPLPAYNADGHAHGVAERRSP